MKKEKITIDLNQLKIDVNLFKIPVKKHSEKF